MSSLKDYYKEVKRYHTKKVSPKIKQDVLVLAGEDDMFTGYFNQQIKALCNAKSCEGRIFTKEENASHHCQIGNIGLALDYIGEWIERKRRDVDIKA